MAKASPRAMAHNRGEILEPQLSTRKHGGFIFQPTGAIFLLNRGKKSHNITVDWKVLGLEDDQVVDVYDVWNNSTHLGNRTVSFTSSVPSHGTTVVKIKKYQQVEGENERE